MYNFIQFHVHFGWSVAKLNVILAVIVSFAFHYTSADFMLSKNLIDELLLCDRGVM